MRLINRSTWGPYLKIPPGWFVYGTRTDWNGKSRYWVLQLPTPIYDWEVSIATLERWLGFKRLYIAWINGRCRVHLGIARPRVRVDW